MAQNDTDGSKIPKNLRLFSKQEKSTLRPDADKKPTASSQKTRTNLIGQRETIKSSIEFDTTEEVVVPRSEIKFDTESETPEIKKESPATQAIKGETILGQVQPSKPLFKKTSTQKTDAPKVEKSISAAAIVAAPKSLERVIAKADPTTKEYPRPKEELKPKPILKPTPILQPPKQEIPKKEQPKTLKAPKITQTHRVDTKKPAKVKESSSLKHIFSGVMIASFFLTVAFLWPYLPFNKDQITLPGGVYQGGELNEMILGESDDDLATDELTLDGNGFAVIDQIDPESQEFEDDLELSAPEDVTQPIVVTTTPPQEAQTDSQTEVQTEAQEREEIEVVFEPEVTNPEPTPPVVTITPEPIVYVQPSNTVGTWGLLNLNTETFDVDDEDDDVTSLYLEDVCRSVYRQNPNAFDYCRETSRLKSSTAEDVGAQRCDGGGSCRVGDTCLLWNSEEEDDGDLKSYTASYLCE